MKTKLLSTIPQLKLACLIMFLCIFSCSKETIDEIGKSVSGETAEAIEDYLANLNYNPDDLLNVQTTTGKNNYNSSENSSRYQGMVNQCITQYYNIRSNFEDVVMFDPGNGVIYPGALVIGNSDMLGGAPQPLQVPRAAASLRVDLPGIGEDGNITIDNPGQNTNVQAGIDKALEHWNANVQPQGYEIDADTYFEKTEAHSSEQMSLDLGISGEWASGSSFESSFSYNKTTEKRVAALLYRQIFYEVTMDTPEKPSAVFGSNAELETIEAAMNSDNPPAYVHSVQYGRIIMIRMETTDTETDVSLEAALSYATGAGDYDGTLSASYKKVISKSTFNVVTIGGNAEVATSVITGDSIEENTEGGLNYVITENALYSRQNPGAPIGYTIKYLKDNRIAKMGYNTDYQIETCGEFPYDHKNVYAKRTTGLYSIRFRYSYFGVNDDDDRKYSGWTTLKDQKVNYSQSPPNGAHDIKVQFQLWDLTWKTMGEFDLDYVTKNYYFEAYCSKTFAGFCTEVSVKEI